MDPIHHLCIITRAEKRWPHWPIQCKSGHTGPFKEYQHQFRLTVKRYRLLDPLSKVFIKVDEETKFFPELAIAISLHLDNSASEIQTFDLPFLDEVSCFLESGLGSFGEFVLQVKSERNPQPAELN